MRHRCLVISALLLGVLVSAPATADDKEPTAQAKAAARLLADEGWRLYSAERYEDALKSFTEAEAKVHAPTFLLMMARTYDKLGRLLDARAVYRRILEEKLAASAPPAFVQAQASAREDLAVLAPRIPGVSVVVSGAAIRSVTLTLDGASLEPSSFVERDPGDHVLIAAMPGRRSVTRTIHLAEAAREQVVLDAASLPMDPASAEPTRAAMVDRQRSAQPHDAGPPSKPLLYTGIALAGVAAGGGMVFGIVSMKNENDADDTHAYLKKKDGPLACAGGQNAADCKALLRMREDAWTYTKVAWGCFGGAAAIGAATLLYYWTAPTSAKATTHALLIPHVGPTSNGVVFTGAW
ncbi:hypothetical protein [Sorangium sp. So ce131]|uniref:hypothetical protein n=1 Tax=Sorangium sp. So ce131 TaxID=3133282 RepID=UPI003F5E8C07